MQLTQMVTEPATLSNEGIVSIGGNFPAVTIGADNLAGIEVVNIYVRIGESWKAVTDLSGNAIVLNANLSAVVLEGGPEYKVTKSTTASPCAIYAIATTRNY